MDAPNAREIELAYSEGKEAVAAQRADIDGLRSRAGVILSAAAIATSFLGGQALRSGTLRPWSWAAIVFFVCLGVGTLGILWPRSWKWEADPRDIIATYIETENPLPLAAIHRDLALHRADALEENRRRFRLLIWVFRISGLLLLAEVGAWVLDLATRVH